MGLTRPGRGAPACVLPNTAVLQGLAGFGEQGPSRRDKGWGAAGRHRGVCSSPAPGRCDSSRLPASTVMLWLGEIA